MNYIRKTFTALSWTTTLRIMFRGISFIKIAVLARVLTPFQFGTFGVLTLTLALLEIITETGINPFLIAEEKIYSFLNTAWVISIVRGAGISLSLYLLSGPISHFFSSPDSFSLLRLAALVPLIRGFINPACVTLVKDLNFKAEFKYRSGIAAVEVVFAVILSVVLRSPLGLVLAMIASAFWEAAISLWLIRPRPEFQFSLAKAKVIAFRGKWITGFGILEYLFTNMDNIVIGRLLGTTSLGLYQNAYKISTLPLGEVNDIVYKTSFPLFSHMLAASYPKIRSTVLTLTFFSVLLMFTLGMGIFLFSKSVVLLLLGPAWLEVVPVVKALAFLGVVKGLAYSFNAVFMAKKKQHIVTIITFVSVLGLALTIFPLVSRFGLIGAAISALIGSALSLPIALYFIARELKISL